MLSKEENELLTKTGPGTPMGELLRRYWMPALLSEEIPAPDCPPVRVRLLGEDLVAFRDSQGKIGLLDEHCSHRGTSLFYGRNEECGLRCIYHGWKYDVEGNVLETPAEPPGSTLKHKVHHKAYPCREIAGMIFTYMGPKEKMPIFPELEWLRLPKGQTFVIKAFQECNYLQGLEGDCDSAHLSYLHSTNYDLYRQSDSSPTLIAEETEFGVRMVAIRKAGPEANYVRVTNFIMPSTGHVSAKSNRVHYWGPIDDTHSWKYSFCFSVAGAISEEEKLSLKTEVGPDYRKIRNPHNNYIQDRQKQGSESYTGVEGFLAQDSCVTESMGPICNRTREHLGRSDVSVIAVRRFLLNAVLSLQAGKEPPCLAREQESSWRPVSVGTVLPSNRSWREVLG
ncbi:MAG TPA: Rieske 2Fe-2S domain-containing protein [Candidatus Binatia bacterium]|jgi:phenylpropionate dioxygenase-like ring-hydroxylating dioxygenase large terminal subunit|nr:Rieske 2Fe-2S domain-containing protein [Candidatus Binatia bacterium]